MVVLPDLKARMQCDEDKCDQSLRVQLVLLPSGGFGLDVPEHAVNRWQLFVDSQNPQKPFRARCPNCAGRTDGASRIVQPH